MWFKWSSQSSWNVHRSQWNECCRYISCCYLNLSIVSKRQNITPHLYYQVVYFIFVPFLLPFVHDCHAFNISWHKIEYNVIFGWCSYNNFFNSCIWNADWNEWIWSLRFIATEAAVFLFVFLLEKKICSWSWSSLCHLYSTHVGWRQDSRGNWTIVKRSKPLS